MIISLERDVCSRQVYTLACIRICIQEGPRSLSWYTDYVFLPTSLKDLVRRSRSRDAVARRIVYTYFISIYTGQCLPQRGSKQIAAGAGDEFLLNRFAAVFRGKKARVRCRARERCYHNASLFACVYIYLSVTLCARAVDVKWDRHACIKDFSCSCCVFAACSCCAQIGFYTS